jgi:hypothetical protein
MKHIKKFVQMSLWVSMRNEAIRHSRLGLRRNGFIVFFLLLGLCFHSFAHAQPGHPYKLSGEMVLNGDVDEYKISPDSSRVVYRADQDTDDVHELFGLKIKTDTCLGDYEPDGDVDGSDHYHLIIGNLTLTIEEFAMNYGKINCP